MVNSLPAPDRYVRTSPFWDGARRRKLLLQFCRDTGRFQHPPRPVSIYTGRRNLEWREVSGAGAIYAFTFARGPGSCIVNVLLDANVHLQGKLLGADEGAIAIGHRVELAWDVLAEDCPYPAFQLSTV